MNAFLNVPLDNLLPFLVACLIIEITPGPNMAFLTLVSATKGRKFGFATVLGVTLGLLLIGFAAAAGLAAAISNSPVLYQILRFAGVLYLCWLAFEEWKDSDQDFDAPENEQRGVSSYFRHGLIINVLNPKAGVFFITILPSFINSNNAIFPQAVSLTLISVVIATTVHLLIVSLAGLLKPVLIENPSRKRFIRRFLSIMLLGVAGWFGFSA